MEELDLEGSWGIANSTVFAVDCSVQARAPSDMVEKEDQRANVKNSSCSTV